jgi:uncharacterized protein (DUF58 family)
MEINRLRLAQFGNLELLAKQVVEGFITGLHKSPFHGFSVEFAEHRLYNTGESTRHIDWKLYGRTDKMFTKKYEEETNLRCQVVIDSSSSMYYPADGLSKFEFSVYAAASLIELLKRQRDAIGLSIFNEKLDLHTAAKTSLAHHRFLYSELEKRLVQYADKERKTSNTIQLLHDIAELTHKRSMVVIFSDLLDDPERLDDFFRAIQHLRHNKHEVVIFHVHDRKSEIEFQLDNRPYQLIDMETGETMRLQPSEVKEKYVEGAKNYFNEIKMRSINNNVDFTEADIAQGYTQILLSYLLKRQKLY